MLTLIIHFYRDTINLLTNFPPGKCALPLLSALNEKMIASSKSKEIMYEGQCMNAPREILYYLIDTVEKVFITFISTTKVIMIH